MSKEIWKNIKGYEGHYMVSNLGNVKSLDRKDENRDYSRRIYGRVLKKVFQTTGYYSITLCKNKNKTQALIHRLVANAFLPNPLNKPCVNHIDGNGLNNNLKNLEWATYQENELHSYRVLGKKPSRALLGKTGPLCVNSKPVKKICVTTNKVLKIYDSVTTATKEIGVFGVICRAARGERKTAYGFKWQYV